MVMVAPLSQHEHAGNGVGLVHRVAQSPLGDLWIALDQRRGPPGEPVLLRYVSLAGGATLDTLDRVVAAAHTAMGLRSELLLPVVDVIQQGPLAVAYQYVEAQPLSTLQTSARARELLFPVGVSLRLVIDLLRGLQAVHESWLGWPTEVPYGGLLPASVLVSRAGRTRLCDALVASSALLQRGFDLSAAELAYRAPEQVYASSPPEPSTDVFIAAVLLWELLSGHRLLSGSKEAIERKLLEHDLPRATAGLREGEPLSRGLLELLDSSLSLDPNRRPPTPGGLATALERCGHSVGSHAEVAAFVHELAGPQLERAAAILRLARGYAAGADDAQVLAAVPSELASGGPRVASAGKPAVALPSGVGASSLAAAVALALERRRASGEFAAFAPEAGRTGAGAPSLGNWAALPPPTRSVVLPRVPSTPPLPWLGGKEPAGGSSEQEEKTTVLRAVGAGDGIRSYTPRAAARLGPKRALLAALGMVVLLIQLWMFALARSHQETSRAASPAEPEPSSEQGPSAETP